MDSLSLLAGMVKKLETAPPLNCFNLLHRSCHSMTNYRVTGTSKDDWVTRGPGRGQGTKTRTKKNGRVKKTIENGRTNAHFLLKIAYRRHDDMDKKDSRKRVTSLYPTSLSLFGSDRAAASSPVGDYDRYPPPKRYTQS